MAGAILAMLAESMIPEAFEQGGNKIGLAPVVGFATAFTLGIFEDEIFLKITMV